MLNRVDGYHLAFPDSVCVYQTVHLAKPKSEVLLSKLVLLLEIL